MLDTICFIKNFSVVKSLFKALKNPQGKYLTKILLEFEKNGDILYTVPFSEKIKYSQSFPIKAEIKIENLMNDFFSSSFAIFLERQSCLLDNIFSLLKENLTIEKKVIGDCDVVSLKTPYLKEELKKIDLANKIIKEFELNFSHFSNINNSILSLNEDEDEISPFLMNNFTSELENEIVYYFLKQSLEGIYENETYEVFQDKLRIVHHIQDIFKKYFNKSLFYLSTSTTYSIKLI